MSLQEEGFEFGEFLLNVRERTLLRSGKPIALTPKAFLLLKTLVESRGRLVTKSELMETVWSDSFVEEGNLAVTINTLRKALGDGKNGFRFIETVPKHGYRFVAEVTEIPARDRSAQPNQVKPVPASRVREPTRSRRILIATAVVLLLLAGSFGITTWYSNRSLTGAPVLANPLSIQKLVASGFARHPVIAADGSNLVFVDIRNDRQSIWLRQLETAVNTEILPPTENIYGRLALSSDNKHLFFTRRPRAADGQLDIYRVPLLGGVPTKIVSETQGPIDVSSDNSTISFVRCYYHDDEFCSLWVADAADGKNERKLVARPRPFRISSNKISPDGKSVAFAVGQSENQSNDFALAEVDIESGSEREITSERFFDIYGIVWLPDQSGLLITASRMPNNQGRIWHLSLEPGSLVPLTTDSESYTSLTIDREGKLVGSTQIRQDFHLHLFPFDAVALSSKPLADAAAADLSADGKIIFSSKETGNFEIWSINADGTGKKQLTNDPSDDTGPLASPDGKFVFFSSNRSGEAHVWRMNADGSLQTQLTSSTGGFPKHVSPDGWLYYLSGQNRTPYRVRTTGGTEEVLLNRRINQLAFNPDGTKAAFFERRDGNRFLTLVALPGGGELKRFPIDSGAAHVVGLDWSADGSSIAFVLAESGVGALWRLSLENEKLEKIVDLGDDIAMEQSAFHLSADGTSFILGKGGWKFDAVLFTGLK